MFRPDGITRETRRLARLRARRRGLHQHRHMMPQARWLRAMRAAAREEIVCDELYCYVAQRGEQCSLAM